VLFLTCSGSLTLYALRLAIAYRFRRNCIHHLYYLELAERARTCYNTPKK
jgi:hypothetical protein